MGFLPGPLDVLRRPLHTLWCEEDDEYHLSDPNPEWAALVLDLALQELAGTPSGCELLERLSAVVWSVGEGYFNHAQVSHGDFLETVSLDDGGDQ